MKAYCINLDKRKDKYDLFKKQTFPFEVVRFPGVDMNVPYMGCLMSHLQILEQSQERTLILEDDCKILQPWKLFYEAISQLPKDWDLLYLGANLHSQLERHSENLYRLKKGWATHGILYNEKIIQRILKDGIKEISKHKNYDSYLARVIQEEYKCFIIYPFFATQYPGYSNITNSFRGCYDFETNFYKHTHESVLY